MPDETVWRTMLFDFYGDLLTDKQREYYDLHYNQDLSLAEIAASSGISRQGVWGAPLLWRGGQYRFTAEKINAGGVEVPCRYSLL